MVTCRFCMNVLDLKHCFSLFNKQGLANNFPTRFSKLLELPVEPCSWMSAHICRNYKTSLTSLEDKLAKARSSAKDSYIQMLPATISTDPTLKRTKETSGVDVSPSTVKTLPPAKKIQRRRQLFPCGGNNQCMCS